MLTNQNKFISLAYRGKNDDVVFDKFDVDEVYIVSLKKHVFSSRLLNLILVYGSNLCRCKKIIQMLQYLPTTQPYINL